MGLAGSFNGYLVSDPPKFGLLFLILTDSALEGTDKNCGAELLQWSHHSRRMC